MELSELLAIIAEDYCSAFILHILTGIFFERFINILLYVDLYIVGFDLAECQFCRSVYESRPAIRAKIIDRLGPCAALVAKNKFSRYVGSAVK